MVFSRDSGSQREPQDLLQQAERPRFLTQDAPPGPTADAAASGTLPDSAYQPRPGATPLDKCSNVIAADARWKGSLVIPDSVRIEGHFNGDIEAKGTVHVTQGASVDARIKATYVVIGGNFKGEVRCSERTELLAKAKVMGDVFTRLFTIHEGAVIDGSIHMSADKLSDEGKAAPGTPRASESANGSRSRSETAAFGEK